MSKTGVFLLSFCTGITIGLLLGYQFFHRPETISPSVSTRFADSSGTHQYFYRLNDSLAARHTVSGSDTGVVHRIDTVAIDSNN
jgi:hypothetical protein